MNWKSKLLTLATPLILIGNYVKADIDELVRAAQRVPNAKEINTLQFGPSARVFDNSANANPYGFKGKTLIDTVENARADSSGFLEFIITNNGLKVKYFGVEKTINSQVPDSVAYNLIVANGSFADTLVNKAPYVATPFNDQNICLAGGKQLIADLRNFKDANNDVLTYIAGMSSKDLVKFVASIEGDFVYATPKDSAGVVSLVLGAFDKNNAYVSDTINVIVNSTPRSIAGVQLTDSIANASLPANAGKTNLGALKDHFSALQSDSVKYFVSVSDTAIFESFIQGDSLYVMPKAQGNATLNVKAQGYFSSPCVTAQDTTASQNVQVAITPSTGITNNKLNDKKMYVYPNPSSDNISLMYNSNASGNVHFDIYSIAGSKVKSIDQVLTPGEQTIPMDISNLANGLYFITVVGSKGSETTKFVKQ